MFGDKNIIQNTGVKYSSLLEQFMIPFESEFRNNKNFENAVETIDFAIIAWNFGNLKSIIDKNKFNEIVSSIKKKTTSYKFMIKMINHKVANFKEYKNFITDYNLYEKNGEPTLTVLTQTEEIYLANTEDSFLTGSKNKDDYEQNYINRSAISLKPLQPFITWYNSIYPDAIIDETDLDEVNIYLIKDSNIYDIETYLKKKFDIYFMMELEDWHTNKKEWPQKRNYKMFKEWFRVDISTAVYDLEKTPVSKITE